MKPITERRRRRPRRSAAWFAAAVLVLLAAACGSSSATAGSGGSPNAGGPASSPLLAFSRCMRSHSVPNFPDPQASGDAKFPSAQELGVSDSRYQAAEIACQRLLPAGAGDRFPPAEVQQLLIGMRQFSQCVRSHGEPNWPDPITDSQGRPVFDLGAHGISRGDYHSRQLQAMIADCQHLLPSALGGGTPVGGP